MRVGGLIIEIVRGMVRGGPSKRGLVGRLLEEDACMILF
jgi:hypothetical protein